MMPQTQTAEYYRYVCDNLGVALVATDESLNIRIWNHAAARMFGAAAEVMVGAPLASVFPRERRSEAERLIRRSFETGEIEPFEFNHRDEHGIRQELIATFAPVVCDSGMRIGASACVRDITQRIALQREVDESRKMRALGELAGTIAHHFNNLLGGIITSADYADESGDPAIMQRILGQIGRTLLRASRLVNGLLLFSEGDPHLDDLGDFTEIILTLADEMEKEIQGRNIELRVDHPKLPILSVPRAQVMTVLRNIVRNAVEAMPQGGMLRVDVSLDEDRLITAISDTGCGLSEAAQARIFEPFWSTKVNPMAAAGEAVGLGLAIAHGLVHMLGGTISVSSELNKGSCFRVVLPRPASQSTP